MALNITPFVISPSGNSSIGLPQIYVIFTAIPTKSLYTVVSSLEIAVVIHLHLDTDLNIDKIINLDLNIDTDA